MRLVNSRGLTLVEVLAVLVILGLVAGTFMVGFSGSFGRAKRELARSGIAIIASKVELFRMEHGRWPENGLGLTELSTDAIRSSPYYLTSDQLLDPWGYPYLYLTPGPDGLPYEILSYGSDGQPGGAMGMEEADVSSAALRDRGAPQ